MNSHILVKSGGSQPAAPDPSTSAEVESSTGETQEAEGEPSAMPRHDSQSRLLEQAGMSSSKSVPRTSSMSTLRGSYQQAKQAARHLKDTLTSKTSLHR
jgi:hypothetical protein